MKHLHSVTVVRPQMAQFGPLLQLIALLQGAVELLQTLGKVPE